MGEKGASPVILIVIVVVVVAVVGVSAYFILKGKPTVTSKQLSTYDLNATDMSWLENRMINGYENSLNLVEKENTYYKTAVAIEGYRSFLLDYNQIDNSTNLYLNKFDTFGQIENYIKSVRAMVLGIDIAYWKEIFENETYLTGNGEVAVGLRGPVVQQVIIRHDGDDAARSFVYWAIQHDEDEYNQLYLENLPFIKAGDYGYVFWHGGIGFGSEDIFTDSTLADKVIIWIQHSNLSTQLVSSTLFKDNMIALAQTVYNKMIQ
jgi:hypothetical protein